MQKQKQAQQNPMMAQFNTFMKNPMQFLAGKNLQIPQEYRDDPKGAVQYLLNNGTMTQDSYNKAMEFANQIGLKLN